MAESKKSQLFTTRGPTALVVSVLSECRALKKRLVVFRNSTESNSMDAASELTIPSLTDRTHQPLANTWDTVGRLGTPIQVQAATLTTAIPTVIRIVTVITAVPTAIRIGTPTVVIAVIGAIVAALVGTHLIIGGAGATPGVLLGVVALARIMMVLQALVQQAPPTRLKMVVVGDGSAVSGNHIEGVPVVVLVSVIDGRKHGQEVSFVQAQVIEEVHGSHPPASLKLAMFSLLPYLEESKTWFPRSLFQTENQVQSSFHPRLFVSFPHFVSLYYFVLHYQLSLP